MKLKRIVPDRVSEKNLKDSQLILLYNLCDCTEPNHTYELINQFNSDPKTLSEGEICFLYNYVVTGRDRQTSNEGYKLYLDDFGKKHILTDKEISQQGYEVVGEITGNVITNRFTQVVRPVRYTLIQIIIQLENYGFKILKTDGELIAYCPKNNATFYISDLHNIELGGHLNHFQQPYISFDNEIALGFFNSFEKLHEEKVDYPIFATNMYLYLHNPNDYRHPFICSMKKIAEIPELYDAVGPLNRALIDMIVADSNEISRTNNKKTLT